MRVKITTLCENNVAQGGKSLIGEHGLSFYIEAGDRRILFDTGQDLGLSHNAEVLGIDLSRIDSVVLSHGHYDHSDGLKSLLDCNKDFTLYAHPDVFGRKMKGSGDKAEYIGIPFDRELLEQKGIKIQLDREPLTIAPGITTTGEIPFANEFETVASIFYLKNGTHYTADTMADDRALILDTNHGLVVLLGCSHRGVINILNHVTRITGRPTIHAIMGGLHLGKAPQAKLDQIMRHLQAFGLEKIGVGHCTGPQAYLALATQFKHGVYLDTVGNVMEF